LQKYKKLIRNRKRFVNKAKDVLAATQMKNRNQDKVFIFAPFYKKRIL
jgi:hypothetical protein